MVEWELLGKLVELTRTDPLFCELRSKFGYKVVPNYPHVH